MITAHVLLAPFQFLGTMTCHIHLTAKDGLERFQSLLLASFVDTSHIIMKLLDTEHVTMVRDGHSTHAIAQGFVYQLLDT